MNHRSVAFAACACTSLLFPACTSAPRSGRESPPAQAATSVPQRQPDSDSFRKPSSADPAGVFYELSLPAPSPIRTAAGKPGPAYWQQRADYDINVTLDDDAGTITARATITYTNNSPDPLPYLWMHVEQNFFRDHSIGNLMREDGGRFGNRGGFEGGCNLTAIRQGGQELKHAVYDTLCRVDLPQPVSPGGAVQFDVEWNFKIPQYGADRLGMDPVQDGVIYQLAQWFPCMASYDDVHGWNTLGYLGQGEFYTNFGDYQVAITVPRSHIVAATGVLQNPQDVLTPLQLERYNQARASADTVVIRSADEVASADSRPAGDGPLTWKFTARDVRTFAWSSSKAFIWDGAFIPKRGAAPSDSDAARRAHEGTFVQSVYPREALPLWSQSTQMLKSAIEGYNRRWFEYPYPTAINVNGRAGGMEYPMIIFCRERKNDRGLFGVTTHEIGHNWFPMVVNTDERRHAWMDEGFNSFINYYSNAEYWKQAPGGRGDASAFAKTMLEPDQQPMDTPADRIRDGRLGTLQYAKPAVMLVLLREVILGEDRFDAAFREYIHAWAFKSPQPADFIRCMENAAGADLGWFWKGWIYGTGTLDHAITTAIFDEESQRCKATFENRGELVMPLTYRVTYDDGSTEDRRLPVEAWFSKTRFTASWNSGGKKPVVIIIDPDERLPDTDRASNLWKIAK
ncbi:MAG TPA: M1 family metallopeptidase [Phycisphaerales bacterium]|nr:M1 family metallopeptidase [Phycisphaerales bacterium]